MKNIFIAILLTALLISAGCSASKQARSLDNQGSGFLTNYSQLKAGEGDEALYRYIKPSVNWGQYRKVIIEPVVVYAPKDSDIAELSRKDRLALVNYFYAAVRKELGQSLRLTNKPGSDTIRVRIALTDAESSNVLSDTTSNIVPFALALSAIKEVAVGRPIGVGDVQIEAEFLDSRSGERLAAMVDRRVGGKSFSGKFDKWDDAKNSFDHWAQRMHTRYLELRKESREG